MTPIPARLEGLQHFPGQAPFELWTIFEPFDNHPKYSTVSINTILEAGYIPVPYNEEVCP